MKNEWFVTTRLTTIYVVDGSKWVIRFEKDFSDRL